MKLLQAGQGDNADGLAKAREASYATDGGAAACEDWEPPGDSGKTAVSQCLPPRRFAPPMSVFFSFDGIDGGGKSTQLKLFCQWLAEQGHEPVVCRDPGSTRLGEQIRGILLASDDSTPIAPRSEMLLYMAARAQLVEEVIRPALEQGKTVVSDRFLLANIVYQGHAGGVPLDAVRQVGAAAIAGVAPDCTFLLDIDPAVALGRMGRQLDRVENRGAEYRERLRAGFLAEAAASGGKIHTVAADRPVEAVQAEIREIAAKYLAIR